MADNGLTPEASVRHWQTRLANTRSTYARIRGLHGENGEATQSVARQLVEHEDAYNAARARLEAAAAPKQPKQPRAGPGASRAVHGRGPPASRCPRRPSRRSSSRSATRSAT